MKKVYLFIAGLILTAALLGVFVGSLFAQDTLWIARIKPGNTNERMVQMLFVRPFDIQYTKRGKINLSCRTLHFNPDSARWDTTEYKVRLTNADTSVFEIQYFTDKRTLPQAFRSGDWKFEADGTFKRGRR